MKVALFGGKGFIGTALRKKSGNSIDYTTFDLKNDDVRAPDSFENHLQSLGSDAVINLAAVLGTMTWSPTIVDLFETNVMGNLHVLRSAYQAGVKNYIFASSLTVHGENAIGDHRDRYSPFNPKHGYSASKAAAEFSMMHFIKEAPDIKIIALRPTMVLGMGTTLPHAPIEFIKMILAGKPIEIYGDGLHEREWIWIDDVTAGITRALEYCLGASPGYHPFILSGNRVSMRDLAQMIAQRLHGEVQFVPGTKQAFTLTSNYGESQKIIGWRHEYNLQQIIDRLCKIMHS